MNAEKQQQTILVVDDEPANIQALGSLLKDEYRIQVANSGEKALAIVRDETQQLPDLILLDIQMPGIDGYEVCRRLKEDSRTDGIVVIFVTARDAVSDEELGLKLGAVDYISKPISPAIVRARVETHMNLKRKTDMLERYALLDGLTGIHNRRYFDEQLEKELARNLREGYPLSVIMMDIDHFKEYNDNYGHGAGDKCLQKVAHALTDTLSRPGDTLCRYGGEEFVVLLPDSDATGARVVAERLREAVEALSLTHEYSAASPVVTLSLGVASVEPAGQQKGGAESLLKRADEALYAAKRAGRNRVG
ncbi:MAG: PleD family two-component system response regulator [Spirochaetaceae bacterium]|nr:MAG: PleD family two-component system response regulator [Spirochaetaceae bacterium]